MIYLLLFYEFLKIGLFAIGGGLVTIPFVFDLIEEYDWTTRAELADIIGIAQSLPGAMGVNIAMFVGIRAAGILGGIIAVAGLVVPAIAIIILWVDFFQAHKSNAVMLRVLGGIKAAVAALILMVTVRLAQVSLIDWTSLLLAFGFLAAILYWKKSPVLYIVAGAVAGLVLNL